METLQEIRADKEFTSANNLISKLMELLEQKKTNIKTNRKAPTEGPTTNLSRQDSSSNATWTIVSLKVFTLLHQNYIFTLGFFKYSTNLSGKKIVLPNL